MVALVLVMVMSTDPLDIERGQSPWSGFTADPKDERDGMHVEAVPFTDALEMIPRLDAIIGHALIAIDRKARRVVVNDKYLSPLARVDALRLSAKDKHVVGTVKDQALLKDLRKLATFFVASSIVQTYAHMASHLRIAKESNGAFEFDGEHEYYTNKRNVARVHFLLTKDKTSGVVTVSGL